MMLPRMDSSRRRTNIIALSAKMLFASAALLERYSIRLRIKGTLGGVSYHAAYDDACSCAPGASQDRACSAANAGS